MIVGRGLDQLHVDVHRVAGFLHAAFQDLRHAQLLRDFSRLSGALLYFWVEVREITLSSAILASRVRISSCMPSAK